MNSNRDENQPVTPKSKTSAYSTVDPDGNIKILILCMVGVFLFVGGPFIYGLNRVTQKGADESRSLALAKGAELAQASGCVACHHVDKKIVGPSFKEIFNKYENDSKAQGKLVKKVKEGGSGVWGTIPMPPNPQIASADIDMIVQWLLIGEFDAAPANTNTKKSDSNQNLVLATDAPGRNLMEKYGCLACHKENEPLVGPSLVDIASKYKNDSDAFALLTSKVRSGGSGNWGSIPMPPQNNVPEGDVKAIINWVLTLNQESSQVTSAHDEITGKAPYLDIDASTRGQTLYVNNCTACHMHGGEGKPGLAPSIRNRDFLALASDDFIKKTIRQGRPGTSMVPQAHLSEQDLDDLVVYLRSIEPRNPVDWTVDESKKITGNSQLGGEHFSRYCASCHGEHGEGYSAGGSGPGIGLKGFLDVASDAYIIKTIKYGRILTVMMPFYGARGLASLSDEEIQDIVVYLRDLQK